MKCHLDEVLVEATLAGVIPMLGSGLSMVCRMIIFTEDMGLVTHVMVMVQRGLMAPTNGKDARRSKCWTTNF